jgi:hypothetical protein
MITFFSDNGGTNGSYDTMVLKYSKDGSHQLWQNAYGSENDDGFEGCPIAVRICII